MAEETALAPSPRRFSFAHLLLLVPWVALVVDAWAPIRDNSFLWHIRAGDLQNGAVAVLTADPFSFTMHGEPWLTQSWLVELLYFWGERNWGLGFVPPMMLLATTVTFLGVGLVAFRRSQSVSGTAVVLILSTLLLISFLVPRPVIFSFALFVLVILAWERPATRWALPLLFWVWASTHGSFAIGLAYVGLTLIAESEWKWLPTAILSGLVTLLTAHGLGVATILLEFLDAGDALALLSEWRKPELISLIFLPFLIGLALIVWAAVEGQSHPASPLADRALPGAGTRCDKGGAAGLARVGPLVSLGCLPAPNSRQPQVHHRSGIGVRLVRPGVSLLPTLGCLPRPGAVPDRRDLGAGPGAHVPRRPYRRIPDLGRRPGTTGLHRRPRRALQGSSCRVRGGS